jgi:hypothetical protein
LDGRQPGCCNCAATRLAAILPAAGLQQPVWRPFRLPAMCGSPFGGHFACRTFAATEMAARRKTARLLWVNFFCPKVVKYFLFRIFCHKFGVEKINFTFL